MRLLPQSLFSRMVLILIGGLVVVQALSVAFHLLERDRLLLSSSSTESAQRIADAVRLLNALAALDRQKLVTAFNSPDLRISTGEIPLSSLSPSRQNSNSAEQAASFAMLLRGLLGESPPIEVTASETRWHAGETSTSRLVATTRPLHKTTYLVQTSLRDGTPVRFEAQASRKAFPLLSRQFLNLLILLAAVIVLSLLAVRLATRPLISLATAAEKLGNDIDSPPLTETGPTEVRRAARAFNTMQSRLAGYLQERARVLAAMSHDLKTPITRLRLRAELLGDDILRKKFAKDLEEMEAMVAATVDFMRGVDNPEPVQPLDVMALLESLQADAAEIGHEVRIEGFAGQPYPCKPKALKRCLVNLIDNAVKYGKRANIVVHDHVQHLLLRIQDQGPGIPQAQLERVFDPFYRLESSRSRDTGGTGLGLGIARNIAQMHGGDLLLHNRACGGLEARLRLPRKP